MIPKKIHYCWFGGNPLSELGEKCLESWKKYCPDYEIIRWDESNYDVGKNEYMKQAYDHGKWGFVSDFARLDIIYEHGGIYFDTDVEIIKPLDGLLENRAFMGFETCGVVAVGLGFGAEPGNETVGQLMHLYEGKSFVMEDGSLNLVPCPVLQTEVFEKLGLTAGEDTQTAGDGCVFYGAEYFCPKDPNSRLLTVTPRTYSVHHYEATWLPEEDRIKNDIREKYINEFSARYSPRKAGIMAEFYTIRDMKGTAPAVTWFAGEAIRKIFRK